MTGLVKGLRELRGVQPAEAVTDLSRTADGTITSFRRLDREFQVYNLNTGQLETVTGDFASRIESTQRDLANLQSQLATNEARQKAFSQATSLSNEASRAQKSALAELATEAEQYAAAIKAATDELVQLSQAQARANRRAVQPRPTFDGSLESPFTRDRPAARGPFQLQQPERQINLGRRSVFSRPLAEIGPQFGGNVGPFIAQALADLTPVSRQRVRTPLPTSPIVGPIPDLSGGITTPTNFLTQLFSGRGPSAQILPGLTETAQGVNRLTDQLNNLIARDQQRGRQAFAADALFSIQDSRRIVNDLSQGIANLAVGATSIPSDLFAISRGGADQRGATAQRASAELEASERTALRRIEEIQRDRELSEQQRADRILKINEELANRRAEIEIGYATRIAEIDRGVSEQRAQYYFNFAQSAISDINRVIQRELVLRLIRDISTSLPGGVGTGILAVASLGLTAAGAGLSAAQASRSQGQAQRRQSAFESAVSEDSTIQLQVRSSDGSVQNQTANVARVTNEGRTPRAGR